MHGGGRRRIGVRSIRLPCREITLNLSHGPSVLAFLYGEIDSRAHRPGSYRCLSLNPLPEQVPPNRLQDLGPERRWTVSVRSTGHLELGKRRQCFTYRPHHEHSPFLTLFSRKMSQYATDLTSSGLNRVLNEFRLAVQWPRLPRTPTSCW